MELKRDRLSDRDRDEDSDEGVSPPPSKRIAGEEDDDEEVTALSERRGDTLIHNTIPGTNIKITTRGTYRVSQSK